MNVPAPGTAVLPRRTRRWRPTAGLAFLAPPTGWLVLFFVLPMLVMLLFSVWQTVNFKIVPTFTLYCLLQSLHLHTLRFSMYVDSSDWQRGHTGLPSSQRSEATNWMQVSSSEKYWIASCKVFGNVYLFLIIERQ